MERMTDYKPKERQDLEELYRKQNVRINELEQENKNLKSDVDIYKSQRRAYKEKYLALLRANTELEEENRKLRAAATMYRNDCKKLRAENEYLHKLLPEADGYIIEKQLEKRLWNDGEEDVYEDWGE